jgi:hypothetical protein
MPNSDQFTATLAHHEAQLENFSGRVTAVESGLRALQTEVHSGFSAIQSAMGTHLNALSSKIDKLDAAPKFDIGRTLNVVKDVAVLFAMTCAGIIYIASGQNASTVAKQEMLNATRTQQIEQLNRRLEALEPWRATVTKKD